MNPPALARLQNRQPRRSEAEPLWCSAAEVLEGFVALLRLVADVSEVEGAGCVECLAGVAGEAAVQQDGAGVAVGAGLPDRERPLVVIAEVLDTAKLDRVVVAVAEVAGQVAVGAAPADG